MGKNEINIVVAYRDETESLIQMIRDKVESNGCRKRTWEVDALILDDLWLQLNCNAIHRKLIAELEEELLEAILESYPIHDVSRDMSEYDIIFMEYLRELTKVIEEYRLPLDNLMDVNIRHDPDDLYIALIFDGKAIINRTDQ